MSPERGLAVVALAVAAAIGACGGKVVIGVGGDSGGVGGAGGAGSSSTSTSSSSSSSSASSSSSGTPCADGGDCLSCFECAQAGPCASQTAACNGDSDCAAFESCTSGCQDLGPQKCFDLCSSQHPNGAKEYVVMVDCAACQTCPSSCTVAFSFYCPVP